MLSYIIKRILWLIPVIIGVSFIVFFIISNIPGDAVDYLAPADATEEQKQELRAELGLDKSVVERYGRYMINFIQGDLGNSYITKEPVAKMYMSRLPDTLRLAGAAVGLSIIVSIPLGVFAALKRGSFTDNACMLFALVGVSIPNFWLGLLLIILFSLTLGWLPSGGTGGIEHLILPAVTLATGLTALLTRTTRSAMLEVLRMDYLRTARAKGASERIVVFKHALLNALIPILTIVGMQFCACIPGAMVTETVFSWAGIGRLIVDSVNMRDVPAITGSVILTAILTSLILLVVDLLYAVVDPRIRVQFSSKKSVFKRHSLGEG